MTIIKDPLGLENNGFEFICTKLKNRKKERICFVKIGHVFWESLIRLGFKDEYINSYIVQGDDNPNFQIPKDHFIFGNGFLQEILSLFKNYHFNDQINGFYFAPSLSPWPFSKELYGIPFESAYSCKSLIKSLINTEILKQNSKIGFTGHEFKLAFLQNKLRSFMSNLGNTINIFVGNKEHFNVFLDFGCSIKHFIEIPSSGSHKIRQNILTEIKNKLAKYNKDSDLLLLISAGGSLSTWIGFNLFFDYEFLNIIDIGGLFAPFNSEHPFSTSWSRIYFDIVYKNSPSKIKQKKEFKEAYNNFIFNKNIRKACFKYINTFPNSIIKYQNYDKSTINNKIPFIENKLYDFDFIKSLLALSEEKNSHANGGPVVSLLEESLHLLLGLPDNKIVICTNNGTSAIQIACGLIQEKYFSEISKESVMRWVVCGFNFASAFIGPFISSIKIDCDKNGLFSLEELKKIPLNKYDGIIYTNTFCNGSEISELINYCKNNNKFIVVDNATGLMDRCVPRDSYIPEIVSFHHTKPWGVGEGGALICDSSDEDMVRKLINYGAVTYKPIYSLYSGNKKISDVSAAAILSRLATYNQWEHLYKWQESRIKSIILDYSLPLTPLSGVIKPSSPRAYTPYLLNDKKIDEKFINKSLHITFRKYYKPFLYGTKTNTRDKLPNAYSLFDHIVCIPNNPENCLKGESEIFNDISKIILRK
ncbi:DegT/DnrJ/EryC1/StrS family aminotransferase [Prochlorococcus sp. AH-736-B04]|nr:DegT/DnrJ/EryC1/StrS family aminotransferase [Prochlorococcus sp. AH-736-B04]